MLKEAHAALAAAMKYKPKGELEEHHIVLVRALLSDAVARLETLPDLIESAGKAQAVLDAERALEAAQAAQRG